MIQLTENVSIEAIRKACLDGYYSGRDKAISPCPLPAHPLLTPFAIQRPPIPGLYEDMAEML